MPVTISVGDRGQNFPASLFLRHRFQVAGGIISILCAAIGRIGYLSDPVVRVIAQIGFSSGSIGDAGRVGPGITDGRLIVVGIRDRDQATGGVELVLCLIGIFQDVAALFVSSKCFPGGAV